MHFSTATFVSLLGLAIHASAAALHSHEFNGGFWQISAKPTGNSTTIGTPLILAPNPDNNRIGLSTGGAGEVPVCVQLLKIIDSNGDHFGGAKIINHPTVASDMFLWKTYGAKYLMSSTLQNLVGTPGNWTFVQEHSYTNILLALDGDTVAKTTEWGVAFGSDIPAAVGGELISLVGVQVEAC